jgi:hypothetical protein
MVWAGFAIGIGEMRIAYNIFFGKYERKESLG